MKRQTLLGKQKTVITAAQTKFKEIPLNILEPIPPPNIVEYFGPSRVRAVPLAAGINVGCHYFRYFGPSEVRALPLAAGINVGGHNKWHCFLFLLSLFLSSSLLFLPEGDVVGIQIFARAPK